MVEEDTMLKRNFERVDPGGGENCCIDDKPFVLQSCNFHKSSKSNPHHKTCTLFGLAHLVLLLLVLGIGAMELVGVVGAKLERSSVANVDAHSEVHHNGDTAVDVQS